MATPIEKLYSIRLGVQGENATTPIEIDMTSWLEEFPTARLHIMFKRYNDNYPYPVITEFDHPILRWIPTVTDTEYIGVGYAEILALDPETDLVKKSRVVPTAVENSVTGAYGQLPVPSPFENWVNQVLAAKDAVDEVASDIEGSAEAAEAAKAAAEAARDAAQAAAGDFQGLSATASGLAAGAAPTVNVTHNEGGLYNLAFGIPKGDKGDQGDPAPAEQVTPAVDAYLAENFANPSNPPLDRSLSSALSAAPADMVGDLKSAMYDLENESEVLSIVDIRNLKLRGGYVNVDNVWKGSSGTMYKHIVLPVSGGETFDIVTNGTDIYYFIATDYIQPVNNESPYFSTETGFTGRLSTADKTSGTLPDDAKYLVAIVLSGDMDLMPRSLKINGYDYAYSIREHITALESGMASMEDLIDDYEAANDYPFVLVNGNISSSGEEGSSSAYQKINTFVPTGDDIYMTCDSAITVYVALYSEDIASSFVERDSYNNTTRLDFTKENFPAAYIRFFVGKNDADKVHLYKPGEIRIKINSMGSPYDIGLSNGKWLAMGDSITQGWYSYINSDGDPDSKSPTSGGENYTEYWVNVAAAISGLRVDDYGIGGSGWVDKGSNSSIKPSARQQIDGKINALIDGQIVEVDSTYPIPDFTKYNLVTLAFGLNDWKGSDNFGSFDDNIQTADTVIANMRYVIESIITANPNCKIIGISPLNCMYGQSSYETNWAIGFSVNGKTLEEAWAVMKSVYDYYNIETIDQLHYSCINRNNIASFLIDKIHPSKVGHILIGREMGRKIHWA